MKTLIRCITAFGLVAGAQQAPAAGFDCTQAASKVEKLICGNERLSAADERMAALYREVLELSADPAALKATQREWLKRRNTCTDSVCVAASYRARSAELDAAWSTAAIAGTYTRHDPDFSGEGEPAEITFKALPDGRLAIDGEALWVGDADTGNVNVGSISGEYALHDDVIEYRDGDDEWSCVLTLKFADGALDVEEPHLTCGGFNVSFRGHYVRVPASDH